MASYNSTKIASQLRSTLSGMDHGDSAGDESAMQAALVPDTSLELTEQTESETYDHIRNALASLSEQQAAINGDSIMEDIDDISGFEQHGGIQDAVGEPQLALAHAPTKGKGKGKSKGKGKGKGKAILADHSQGNPDAGEVGDLMEGKPAGSEDVPGIDEMAQLEEDAKQMASEIEDADRRSIYCGNVDYGATPSELQEHFKSCGTLSRITILCNKFTGHPKGLLVGYRGRFAYVEFTDEAAVQNAVLLNDTVFRGRQIKVVQKRTNQPGLGKSRGKAKGKGKGKGYYYGSYTYKGRGKGKSKANPY